ncbi:hypothetical protein [Geodermatophilus sp. URMC 63]
MTTEEVTAAADALRVRLAPAGLVVSTGKPSVTVVPDRGSLRDGAVRELLHASWVSPQTGDQGGLATVRVHPDVQFSLGLDEGFTCSPAVITVQPGPKRRSPLPWLADADEETP